MGLFTRLLGGSSLARSMTKARGVNSSSLLGLSFSNLPKKKPTPFSDHHQRILLEELEACVLYSADTPFAFLAQAAGVAPELPITEQVAVSQSNEVATQPGQQSSARREIVFIDSLVSDVDQKPYLVPVVLTVN